jgi:hypothetical protein
LYLEGLIDTFLSNTHRLEQNRDIRKLRWDLHQEVEVRNGEIRAEPVQSLDSMLLVVSSQAHVGLAVLTIDAIVRPTNGRNHKIALRNSLIVPVNTLYCRERLVPCYEITGARRSLTIEALVEIHIRSTYSDFSDAK